MPQRRQRYPWPWGRDCDACRAQLEKMVRRWHAETAYALLGWDVMVNHYIDELSWRAAARAARVTEAQILSNLGDGGPDPKQPGSRDMKVRKPRPDLPSAKAARMASELTQQAAKIEKQRELDKAEQERLASLAEVPDRTMRYLASLGPQIRKEAELGKTSLERDISSQRIDRELLRQKLIQAGYRVCISPGAGDVGDPGWYLTIEW